MKTKLLKTTVESRLGKKLSTRDTLIGSSPRALKRKGSRYDRARPEPPSGRHVHDGSDLSVDAVIRATGFEFDHSWIQPAVKNENGAIHIGEESRPSRASISSGCPGSTPADRRCSAGSRTTLNTSPSRSQASADRPSSRRRNWPNPGRCRGAGVKSSEGAPRSAGKIEGRLAELGLSYPRLRHRGELRAVREDGHSPVCHRPALAVERRTPLHRETRPRVRRRSRTTRSEALRTECHRPAPRCA